MGHSGFGKHDPSDGNKSRSSMYFVDSSCPAQPSFLFFGDVQLSLPRLAVVVGYRSSAEAQETRAGFHSKEKWFDYV